MVRVDQETLVLALGEALPRVELRVGFQRTLRLPDDEAAYPRPPGLGRFPLELAGVLGDRRPAHWRSEDVVFPIAQSEAMCLHLRTSHVEGRGYFPFAIKVAIGARNALTGGPFSPKLGVTPRDYVVAIEHLWLDRFAVESGVPVQFVASSSDETEIHLYGSPLKRAVFEKLFPERNEPVGSDEEMELVLDTCSGREAAGSGHRCAPEIYDDPFGVESWDQERTLCASIRVLSSRRWRSVTGEAPPTFPPSAREYEQFGIPWFDCYDEELQSSTSGNAPSR